MATLLSPQDEEQPQGAPLQTAPSASTSSNVGGATSSGPVAAGQQPSPQPTTQNDAEQIANANQNFDFSPLLGILQGEGTAARSAIGNATNQFDTAVGSAPTFGSTDQSTLNDVLGGKQPLTTGQSLLSTAYKGPSSFNTSSFAPQVSKYTSDVQNAQTPDFLTNLLASIQPSLSPGEQRFDALALGNNKNFQGAAKGLLGDANDVSGLSTKATNDANTLLGNTQKGFSDYDTAAKGYVSAQRDAINNLLNTAVTNAQTKDTALQAEAAALQKSGADLTDAQKAELAAGTKLPAGVKIAPQGLDSTKWDAPDPATNWKGYVPGVDNDLDLMHSLIGRINAGTTTLNPNGKYVSYAGDTPNVNNMATPDQSMQFNNAEQLLNEANRITPPTTPYNPGALTFSNTNFNSDAAAQQQALQQLTSEYNGIYAPWAGFFSTIGHAKGGPIVGPSYEGGGYVPPDAGPPMRDGIITRVNRGEEVIRQPSVNAVGKNNVEGINQADQMPPAKQQALRTAIGRALGSR